MCVNYVHKNSKSKGFILKLHQYSKTNVMHFLFSLLGIKSLYMFPASLTHPQEAFTKGTWYIACVLCQLAATRIEVELVSETRTMMHGQ
jgi:ABC-type thiamin/hydroxymethylpyrimidine transport system permease subunit